MSRQIAWKFWLGVLVAQAAGLWHCPGRAAAAAEPAIVGPAEVQPGDLAVFRLADVPAGHKGIWRIWPKQAEANALPVVLPDGGSAVVFASRTPQTLLVIYAFGTADGAVVLLHECRNGTPSPGPSPPGPTPPGPTPPGPTPPGPTPPRPAKQIVWIEESAERTPGQAEAITDRASREALRQAGWLFRVVDKDVRDESGKTPAELANVLADAEKVGYPVVYVYDGQRAWFYKPVPGSAAEMRAFLAQLGIQVAMQGTAVPRVRTWPWMCPDGRCVLPLELAP